MTSGSGLRILAGPLRGGGSLVRDYLAGRDLDAFYTGSPGDIEAYTKKAAEVEARLDATSRARVAAAIQPLGDAADRLRRILDGDGFFVTTGQQPALFGGPLYTIYKILAAIRLADELEQKLKRPVLALFWVGSDDHDWEEANHTAVLDREDHVRRLSVAAPEDVPPLPLGQRAWGQGVLQSVDELIALLPASPAGARLAAHVRQTYTPTASVAVSSTATLRLLLEGERLAIVDSADPVVRRAAVPVLLHEAEHWQVHNHALTARTRQLEQLGYAAQVAIAADASNLMLIDEHGRDRLVRARGGWSTRRGHRALSDAGLIELIRAEPGSFSPNVLLRPVVESALFPTLAYVAGPGELRYFAQIGDLYRAHGIMPPVVVPRPSVLLIEATVARLLSRLELEPAAFEQRTQDLENEVIRAQVPAGVQAALARIRADLHAGYDELIDAALAVDPTLRGPLTGARNASLIRAYEAERKVAAHLRRRNGVLLEQLRRAAAHLRPEDTPQERVLNALPYVAQYGEGLIAAVRAALPLQLSS